nr:hypothetical protein GCM10020185_51870 [Pseudomonas brassicacearum subsp. brassicacearum]
MQSSWVAEATSCAQQFIHAAYRKLEPGYADTEFDKRDLATWELYNNYPDWSALQMIGLYPEKLHQSLRAAAQDQPVQDP